MNTARRLRELIARPGPFFVPNMYDALTAMIAESLGYEAVFMSGAGVEAALLGKPDLGFISMTEAATQARYMANAISIPLFCDCDIGYGHSLNVARTVREFEQNGAAGVMIEDQTALKRAPYVGGATVIPREQFVGKIKAAVRARQDSATVIMARIDAYESMGFQEVVDRANACVDVGADMIFVAGLFQMTDEERHSAPQRIRAPMMGAGDRAATEGYKLILWPGSVQAVAFKAVKDYLAEAKKRGSDRDLKDRAQPWEEFEEFIGLRAAIREAVEEYAEPARLSTTG